MTVIEELKSCLETRRDIKDLDLKIAELRGKLYSPKNQIISGMPKAMGGGNLMDSGLIRLELLTDRRKKLEANLNKQWENIQIRDTVRYLTETQYELIYLRFYEGSSWKEVMIKLDMSSNKVFKMFRITKSAIEKGRLVCKSYRKEDDM